MLFRCLATLLLTYLLPASSAAPGRAEPRLADDTAVLVGRVYMLLNYDHAREGKDPLVAMGERAFPAFETLLADPKMDPTRVSRIFLIVRAAEAGRSRFLEHAVRRLTDEDRGVRYEAVRLIAVTGKEREAIPVAALLADPQWEVARAAADALAAIGGERALPAMDVWLASGALKGRGDLHRHVGKLRDDLKQRIETNKKPLP